MYGKTDVEVFGGIWSAYRTPKDDLLSHDVRYIGSGEDGDIYEANSDFSLKNGKIIDAGDLLLTHL